ncbi:unnamed protein product [Notodromas monacha]|uniref:Peptidase S1 domain-containing protein n=1 Tax=Notodromas monacha TaxID=399045 RepID=A0A7R9BKC5_9CRUS|nr:unnamed protein product [Notodromas monacha]CAG0915569.1 unnamed protein product [Notodromas monacha]
MGFIISGRRLGRAIISLALVTYLLACQTGTEAQTEGSTSALTAKNGDVEPVVINGSPVVSRSQQGFAHLARIVYQTFPGSYSQCTGSLISTRFVVTAGHCLSAGFLVLFRYKYTKHTVTLGDLVDSKTGETNEVTISGKGIPYPLYPAGIGANDPTDIGLIFLNSEVTLNADIQPINLPPSDYTVPIDSTCTVAGWGVSEEGGSTPSDTLLFGYVKLADSTACGAKKDSKQMCFNRGTTNQNSCSGDSGGPITYNNYLIATVSFGRADCTSAAGAIRVSAYVDWINSVTKLLG